VREATSWRSFDLFKKDGSIIPFPFSIFAIAEVMTVWDKMGRESGVV
jgi:hypothetical protein